MENLNQEGMGMPGMSPEKKSYGPLIAVIIILALVVIGGLYFLGQRMSGDPYANMDTETTADENVEALNSQSDSDETASIEADLKATNVDGLDQGAAAIESEI